MGVPLVDGKYTQNEELGNQVGPRHQRGVLDEWRCNWRNTKGKQRRTGDTEEVETDRNSEGGKGIAGDWH